MTSPSYWFEGFDGYPLITSTAAVEYFIKHRGYSAAQTSTGTGGFYNDAVLGGYYTSGKFSLRFEPPPAGLHDTFVFGGALYAESLSASQALTIIDANAVQLKLYISLGTWKLDYNPTGTGNDINATNTCPLAVNFYEIVWSPSTLKLFINNEEVYSKNWAGVAARPQLVGPVDSLQPVRAYSVYYSSSRLGMHRVRTLPLEAPTVDTGTETGAASPQLALGSFDGDTSYYTVANASGEKLLMTLGDLPVTPDTIHGVKTTLQSRKTDSGSITGTVLMKTGSENSIGTMANAVGYAGTHLVTTVDPHTAAAFTPAAINSMEIGFKEGA